MDSAASKEGMYMQIVVATHNALPMRSLRRQNIPRHLLHLSIIFSFSLFQASPFSIDLLYHASFSPFLTLSQSFFSLSTPAVDLLLNLPSPSPILSNVSRVNVVIKRVGVIRKKRTLLT